MPELPDVEIFRQYLNATALHQTIETVEIKGKEMAKGISGDRLCIGFDNGYHVTYDCQRKLGEIGFTRDPESIAEKKGLGPDAMDPGFVFSHAIAFLP
jgi:formamidopyrimidine-DNA glycosylase